MIIDGLMITWRSLLSRSIHIFSSADPGDAFLVIDVVPRHHEQPAIQKITKMMWPALTHS